jgi:hypothetical protein
MVLRTFLTLVLFTALGPCSGKSTKTPAGSDSTSFRLEGSGCRRTLFKGSQKLCDSVVVSVGNRPCEESIDLLDGGSTLFGSGCEGATTLAGPMGKELFFWESPEAEGFIVLCDDAKVDHIEEFADAKVRCFEQTK